MKTDIWQEKVFRGEGYDLPTDRLYYIEGANARLDEYVRAHEKPLNRSLQRCGWSLERIALTPQTLEQYLSLRPDIDLSVLSFTPGTFISPLAGSLLYRVNRLCNDDEFVFLSADISDYSPDDLEELLESFLFPAMHLKVEDRCCEMSMSCPEPPVPCAGAHEKRMSGKARTTSVAGTVQQQFIDELESALSRLSEEGMNIFLQTLGNDFLRSVANLAPRPLSRIEVDERFRILLPDYNMEIKMNALWKAIYILFMHHPEGIVLKDMPDYRTELAQIYYAMGTGEYERMEATLDDITTPGSDNFRQYLSKINKAFTSVLAIDLAQHYIISGQRGKPYGIQVLRSGI